MTWLPIETAPKDGTYLLLFFPSFKRPVHIGRYSKSEHFEHGVSVYRSEDWFIGALAFVGRKDHEPTHWMPLPPPPEMLDEKTALERAKDAAKGPQGLARAIGSISSQAISQWKRVPATRVLEVERITGIPRHELRPDIFPMPERAA